MSRTPYARYDEATLIAKTHTHVANILVSIGELEKMIAVGHLPDGRGQDRR